MIKKVVWVGLTLSLFAFASAVAIRADEFNKKTTITFSQPVEIPGHVLPAGTYIFKLVDSLTDRHTVQIFNADGSQIIATVMAVPDYRLTATDKTVINFKEVPVGSPDAIRAWFYPGNTVGQEFVYPKPRAMQLAQAAKAVVPAIEADLANLDALKTAPIMAITPEAKEMPLAAAIQTTPAERDASVATDSSPVAGTTGVKQAEQNDRSGRRLPQTASALPLIVLFGLASIGVAAGLMIFGRRATASVL